MTRSLWSGAWKAALLYAALTVLFAYPLSLRAGEALFGDNPDTHLFIWILAWDAHAFLHQPLAIFDANIYYPYPLTLAYSENLIGLAVFAAPVLWLTGNPVLAMNVAALLACVLCGVGGYVLGRRVGLGSPAAIICGLVFAFSPARFVRTGQLHVGAVQWIPFTLASLHAYLDHGGKWHLRAAVAFFSLQALTTGHGAVYLTVAAGGLLAYRLLLGERLALWRRLRDLGLSGVLLFVPTVLVFLPYARVRAEMGFRRTFERWEPTAGSFLAGRVHLQHWLLSWFPGPNPIDHASAYLFPGFVPLLLAGVAIISVRWRYHRPPPPTQPVDAPGRRWSAIAALLLELTALIAAGVGILVLTTGSIRLRVDGALIFSARDAIRPGLIALGAVALRFALRSIVPFRVVTRVRRVQDWWRRWGEFAAPWRRDPTIFYALLTLGSVWLLLPPPLGLWPHVYSWPGFNLIRVAGRFVVVGVLAIAVLAAIGFDRLAARLSIRRRAWFAWAVGVAIAVECAGMPLPVAPFRVDIPGVDRWLATRPAPFVVAEFPVVPSARYQSLYMLHSMAHWQKTVHGYSGFEAPLHTELFQVLRSFPDEPSLKRLRELHVQYLVVHEDLYPPGQWPEVEKRLQQFRQQLVLEYATGEGRVYSLR